MSSWLATLRIARRDARRARGRSALVIAMIALPVAGVGLADVTYRTFQLSDEQQATRTMGAADARVQHVGGTEGGMTQDSRGGIIYTTEPPAQGPLPEPPADPTAADLSAALPDAVRVLAVAGSGLTFDLPDRVVRAEVSDLPWTDPLAAGLFTLESGRAATSPTEVVVTPALAERLDLGALPATVSTERGEVTVVGTVRAADYVGAETVLGSRSLMSPQPGESYTSFLVDLPGAVTAEQALAANAAGFAVTGRTDIEGLPAPQDYSALDGTVITAIVLVVGMVLLEIVLLAGPAFAVGAKRQRRELALLSATGGSGADVRRVVLGSGVVLGAVGGLLGAALGIALTAALLPVLTRTNGTYPGPFEVRPLDLLAIAGVGLVTALLAAYLPARSASREDPVAGLTGRRGAVGGRRRTPVVALVAVAVGAGVAYFGATSRNVTVILLGSVVAELGLVALTPSLVGLAGRFSPHLPLVPRLALRDAARNRSRTAPAVAAILAAVAGGVSVSTFVASQDRREEMSYAASAPEGTVIVNADGTSRSTPDVIAALDRIMPITAVAEVQGLNYGSVESGPASFASVEVPLEQQCPLYLVGAERTAEAIRAAEDDPRCTLEGATFSGGYLPAEMVGDSALVATLGRSTPETDAALAAGGAVAPARLVSDGMVRVLVSTNDPVTGEDLGSRTVDIAAAALPSDSPDFLVFSPAAARTLGVVPGGTTVVAATSRMPTDEETDRLTKALAAVTEYPSVYVERGYVSDYGIGLLALVVGSGLIVLGASSIATGLAAADGRADLATLAAVGATPSVRRRLAAFQSATTAVLGTALGVVAGLVPALGLIRALNAGQLGQVMPYVLPWSSLLAIVVGVPLVAALAAAAFTRSKLPLDRRIA